MYICHTELEVRKTYVGFYKKKRKKVNSMLEKAMGPFYSYLATPCSNPLLESSLSPVQLHYQTWARLVRKMLKAMLDGSAPFLKVPHSVLKSETCINIPFCVWLCRHECKPMWIPVIMFGLSLRLCVCFATHIFILALTLWQQPRFRDFLMGGVWVK